MLFSKSLKPGGSAYELLYTSQSRQRAVHDHRSVMTQSQLLVPLGISEGVPLVRMHRSVAAKIALVLVNAIREAGEASTV